MSIAFVREKIADTWTSGASIAITSLTAPADGNALILQFDGSPSANSRGVSSISQTGATWVSAVVLDANSGVNTRRIEIWYALNVAGAGTTITINLNYTPTISGGLAASYAEFSGLATSGALDATGTASNTNTGTAITTGSVTPTATGQGLIFAATRLGGNYSAGPDSSFNRLTAASARGDSGYLITTLSGSYNVGWTAASGVWAAAVAVFNPPSGEPAMRRFGGASGFRPLEIGRDGTQFYRVERRQSGLLTPDRSLILPQPEMRLAG